MNSKKYHILLYLYGYMISSYYFIYLLFIVYTAFLAIFIANEL